MHIYASSSSQYITAAIKYTHSFEYWYICKSCC